MVVVPQPKRSDIDRTTYRDTDR